MRYCWIVELLRIYDSIVGYLNVFTRCQLNTDNKFLCLVACDTFLLDAWIINICDLYTCEIQQAMTDYMTAQDLLCGTALLAFLMLTCCILCCYKSGTNFDCCLRLNTQKITFVKIISLYWSSFILKSLFPKYTCLRLL